MFIEPDITITDARGQPVTALEVVGVTEMSAAGSTRHFKAMKESGSLRGLRFYGLITPDRFSSWSLARRPRAIAKAGKAARVAELPLPIYIREQGILDSALLAQTVYLWLIKVRELGIDRKDTAERRLADLGFFDAIADARFDFGAAA
jgi:hypothetical protein